VEETVNTYKKITGVLVVIVVILAAALILLVLHGQGGGTVQTTSVGSTTQSQTSNSSAVLFANSQYAQFANLLYSPSNPSASYAAAGFNISITKLTNGSVRMTISTLSNRANNSTFVFKTSDSLYFIESSLGDDSPPSGDYNLGDDGAVLVNSAGYLTSS
jgi:hypothetical protein